MAYHLARGGYMMQQKDTEELEEALTEVQDVRDYFAANADEFTKR
jgi:hypothetical protein